MTLPTPIGERAPDRSSTPKVVNGERAGWQRTSPRRTGGGLAGEAIWLGGERDRLTRHTPIVGKVGTGAGQKVKAKKADAPLMFEGAHPLRVCWYREGESYP